MNSEGNFSCHGRSQQISRAPKGNVQEGPSARLPVTNHAVCRAPCLARPPLSHCHSWFALCDQPRLFNHTVRPASYAAAFATPTHARVRTQRCCTRCCPGHQISLPPTIPFAPLIFICCMFVFVCLFIYLFRETLAAPSPLKGGG